MYLAHAPGVEYISLFRLGVYPSFLRELGGEVLWFQLGPYPFLIPLL